MISLAGKVVLVTGGASGLGLASATQMAELGAKVILADINETRAHAEAEALRERGYEALGLAVDIADEASVQAMAAEAKQAFGRIDVLVNSAAATSMDVVGADKDVVTTDLAIWDKTMQVNLRGTMLVSRSVIPLMIEGGGGSIVHISSRQGLAPARGARVAYGVSKAAIIMLSRHIAASFGKQGIRSNAVAPGAIRTDHWVAVVAPEAQARTRDLVLTTELGEPSDISQIVAYLASDASKYVTGQTFTVDGGFTTPLAD